MALFPICPSCGHPVYGPAREAGMHPCCAWWYEQRGVEVCPACRTSAALNRQHERLAAWWAQVRTHAGLGS